MKEQTHTICILDMNDKALQKAARMQQTNNPDFRLIRVVGINLAGMGRDRLRGLSKGSFQIEITAHELRHLESLLGMKLSQMMLEESTFTSL